MLEIVSWVIPPFVTVVTLVVVVELILNHPCISWLLVTVILVTVVVSATVLVLSVTFVEVAVWFESMK